MHKLLSQNIHRYEKVIFKKKTLVIDYQKTSLTSSIYLNIQLTIANVVVVGIQQLQIGNGHGYLPYNLYKD